MPDSSHNPKSAFRPAPLVRTALLALALCVAGCSARTGGQVQGQPQDSSQPSRSSQSSDALDGDALRILDAIYVQMDDIRTRLSPLGTPESEWPVDAKAYIQQAKETGAWPGEESGWPTDGSLDDPRVLVEVCRECEDYINRQTPEHWETDGLRHPYALEGADKLSMGLDQVPLVEDIGVIVDMIGESEDMGPVCTAVLWRGGKPVEFGISWEVGEADAEARKQSQVAVGGGAQEKSKVEDLEKALADDEVMAGRKFDVSQTSKGRIRVCVSEGEDDERLGYPLRTEEGLLSLVESLGDALPSGTEIVVSSDGGSRDVVGCCVSTCDFSEQPVVELSLERYGSREEAEEALHIPISAPAELNGKNPYAWDVAVTRSRENHDLGAVARPVLVVRYGSPSDVEGVIVMGDFRLNDVCDEFFEDDDQGDFRYVDEPGGRTSKLALHECDGTIRVDWYVARARSFAYDVEFRKTKDMRYAARVDELVLKIQGETYLGPNILLSGCVFYQWICGSLLNNCR